MHECEPAADHVEQLDQRDVHVGLFLLGHAARIVDALGDGLGGRGIGEAVEIDDGSPRLTVFDDEAPDAAAEAIVPRVDCEPGFDVLATNGTKAWGEKVQKYRWFWGPAPHTRSALNFATNPLRATRWLHRRIDVDYNGWWMCLIPRRVAEELGVRIYEHTKATKLADCNCGLR